MIDKDVVFKSLQEVANYGGVTRQAIYEAIKNRGLKATKVGLKWNVKLSDYDEYRANRHNRDMKMCNGQRVFNVDEGRLTVLFVAKAISDKLGRPYNTQRIYYLIRKGEVRASRHGISYILTPQEAEKLYHREIGEDINQLRFA